MVLCALKSQEIKTDTCKEENGTDVLKLIGFEVKEVRRNAETKPPRGRMNVQWWYMCWLLSEAGPEKAELRVTVASAFHCEAASNYQKLQLLEFHVYSLDRCIGLELECQKREGIERL